MLLNKSDRDPIRKTLKEIDQETPNRTQQRRLLEELNNILLDLEFKKKYINNAFDSSSYYDLKDLEYTFGDLDDYYKPVLAKENFNGSYQMFTCRWDKERNMYITNYLDKIKPYLIPLIDEKKVANNKIQFDIATNFIHLTKSDRITFYVKSQNIESYMYDNSQDILNQLYGSLLKYFNDKLLICKAERSYVFGSFEGFSIHFHEKDLKQWSSYIPIAKWLEIKKATINPKNIKENFFIFFIKDNYFLYAPNVVIFHKEKGDHPERISSKLLKYAYKLDWNGIGFPAFTSDYKVFEKNNKGIALNILYVPYEQEEEIVNVLPEYEIYHQIHMRVIIPLVVSIHLDVIQR